MFIKSYEDPLFEIRKENTRIERNIFRARYKRREWKMVILDNTLKKFRYFLFYFTTVLSRIDNSYLTKYNYYCYYTLGICFVGSRVYNNVYSQNTSGREIILEKKKNVSFSSRRLRRCGERQNLNSYNLYKTFLSSLKMTIGHNNIVKCALFFLSFEKNKYTHNDCMQTRVASSYWTRITYTMLVWLVRRCNVRLCVICVAHSSLALIRLSPRKWRFWINCHEGTRNGIYTCHICVELKNKIK